jgi:TM2 domain-containing membrane protein YozV
MIMIKVGSAEWWGNLVTFLLLSVLLGIAGIDRFYKGEPAWGVIKLITGGGVGIWYIVDVCIFAYRLGTTGQWTKGEVSRTAV